MDNKNRNPLFTGKVNRGLLYCIVGCNFTFFAVDSLSANPSPAFRAESPKKGRIKQVFKNLLWSV